MVKLVNRAKMTTATTGTGTITLGSASDGYQSFAAAGVSNGDEVRYAIEDGNGFELGVGQYTASGSTLSRTVSESSNSGNALNLSGNAVVFVTAIADDVGVRTYATISAMTSATAAKSGALAFVTANSGLYQNNGNGWYKVATVNTSPTISAVQDASSNTTPFSLATNGTATVITITAADVDEGTDLTYSHSVTSGSLNGTTVTQGTGASENVFTVTPHASNATTFSLTFNVTDSINTAQSVAAFTLSFGWAGTQQAELTDTSGGAYDRFGKSVGIDDATAIVGNDESEAFVFTKSGSTWSQQQKITNSASGFGYAADVSGDYAVVGAYGASTAYVYYRSGTTWSLQATLTGTSGTHFGWSAAIDGDTVVVGAPEEDTTASNSGAIYVYTRSGTTWSLQGSMIKASDASGSSHLGYSVDIDGDNIIAGAYKDNASFGAAYVFTRSGTTWSQQQKLTSTNPSSGANKSSEQFGYSVGISGNTCAVGAWFERTTYGDSGAVWIFDRSGTTWGTPTQIKASDAAASDRFGSSVAIDGNRMVAGALFEDTTAGGAGQAYLFSRSGSTWSEDDKVQGANVMSYAMLGSSAAISDKTAIIAAVEQTSGSGGSQAGAGAAYIFI